MTCELPVPVAGLDIAAPGGDAGVGDAGVCASAVDIVKPLMAAKTISVLVMPVLLIESPS
jgi:hypothetical protein